MSDGDRLRKWRLSKNFTVEELACALDVTTRTIRNYENNKYEVPTLVWIALDWYDGKVYKQ